MGNTIKNFYPQICGTATFFVMAVHVFTDEFVAGAIYYLSMNVWFIYGHWRDNR